MDENKFNVFPLARLWILCWLVELGFYRVLVIFASKVYLMMPDEMKMVVGLRWLTMVVSSRFGLPNDGRPCVVGVDGKNS